MTFKKGNSANPGGLPKASRQALTKIRAAINMGIDNMKAGKVVGVVALSQKITEALENEPIRTLKDLSSLLPKDIQADVTTTVRAADLSDDELAEIILARNASRQDQEKAVIEVKPEVKH